MTFLYIVLLLGVVLFQFNLRVRKTNAYRNFYRTIHVVKDVSKDRQYSIGAFGSTFAYYAFDLKKFDGHNFSVEPQSIRYMRKTIEHYLRNIKDNGYAIISLAGCFFAAESTKTDEDCTTYYSFLRPEEFDCYHKIVKIKYLLKRYLPALSPYYAKCVFKDEAIKYSIQDGINKEHALKMAQNRLGGWERVVGQRINNDFKANAHLFDVICRNVDRMKDIIQFIRANHITPVFVILPMSEAFNDICPKVFYKEVMYKSLNMLKDENVPVLDYLYDEELCRLDYYMSADCLNQKGRVLLSEKISNELQIMNK